METRLQHSSTIANTLVARLNEELSGTKPVDLFVLLIYNPKTNTAFDRMVCAALPGMIKAADGRIQVALACKPVQRWIHPSSGENEAVADSHCEDDTTIGTIAFETPFSFLSLLFGGFGDGLPILIVSDSNQFDRYQSIPISSSWAFIKLFSSLAENSANCKARLKRNDRIIPYGSTSRLSFFQRRLFTETADPALVHGLAPNITFVGSNLKEVKHEADSSEDEKYLHYLFMISNQLLTANGRSIMLALSNCSCSPLRSFLTYLPFLEKASATSIVSAAVGYATISNSFENGSGEFDGCILSLCKAIEREWNASFVHTKRRELGINVLQYYFRHQPGLGKTSTICDNVDFNRSGKEMGNYLAWNPPTLGQSIHALTTKPPPNLPLEKDFILRELESIKDIRNESAHECITKEQADSHIATIEKAVQNRLFDELLIAKKNEKPNAFASVAKKEWARLSSFNSRLANDLRQSP